MIDMPILNLHEFHELASSTKNQSRKSRAYFNVLKKNYLSKKWAIAIKWAWLIKLDFYTILTELLSIAKKKMHNQSIASSGLYILYKYCLFFSNFDGSEEAIEFKM